MTEIATQSPAKILQLGSAFWGSKTLLGAVELGLFTHLAQAPLKRIAMATVEKLCLLVMSRIIKAARRDLAGRDDCALSNLGIDRGGVHDLLSEMEQRQWAGVR
jgi:hypothetical protein